LPWLLMNKIAGSSSWLIQRQGMAPAVWGEKLDSTNQKPASQAGKPQRVSQITEQV